MKSIEWSPESGEDAGKLFVITRMNAFDADKWAGRVIRSLIRAGVKIPEDVLHDGMTSLSSISLNLFAEMSDEDCEYAFNTLMGCCKIIRAPGAEPARIISADIENPQTLVELRVQSFRLHVDFFKAFASQIFPLAEAVSEGLPQAAAE